MDDQTESALETLQSLPNGAYPPGLVEYLSRRWSKMLTENPAETDAATSDAEPDGGELSS